MNGTDATIFLELQPRHAPDFGELRKKEKPKKTWRKQTPVEFEEGIYLTERKAEEIVALDEALEKLEKINERQARVIECRYFAGYNIEETATILDVSPATVKRDWTLAKAWLFDQIHHSGEI